jgi:hypothetical protein
MPLSDTATDYDRARVRLENKRKFRRDLVAYVVINGFLIGIWATSGAGYFWPGWVLAGWGLGLTMRWWDLFYGREITEDDIQREMRRGRSG